MKLITFDFWNTLFVDRHEEIRHKKRIDYAHRVFQRYRPHLDLQYVERAFQAGNDLFQGQWDHRRSCSMQDHVREMIRNVGLDVPQEDLHPMVEYFETVLLEYPPLLIQNAGDAIRFAASKAMVGLISDTGYTPGRILRRILQTHQLESCFHAFSFSNETGVLKPNPITFKKILDELNILPDDAVHIGDLEDSDIAGAKQVGMKAIKYIGSNPSATPESIADAVIDDLNQLESALSSLGSRLS